MPIILLSTYLEGHFIYIAEISPRQDYKSSNLYWIYLIIKKTLLTISDLYCQLYKGTNIIYKIFYLNDRPGLDYNIYIYNLIPGSIIIKQTLVINCDCTDHLYI